MERFTKEEKSVLHTLSIILVAIFVICCNVMANANEIKVNSVVSKVEKQIAAARGKATKGDRFLATKIVKVSNEYNINPHLYTAILAHESMFRLDAVNAVSHDYGIAQINIKNIRRMQLDLDLILTDLEYSLRAGAQVLSHMRKNFSAHETSYACRYNVGTAKVLSPKLKAVCVQYMSKINSYYVAGQ